MNLYQIHQLKAIHRDSLLLLKKLFDFLHFEYLGINKQYTHPEPKTNVDKEIKVQSSELPAKKKQLNILCAIET